jgi:glucosamine 6-phosphate synthetase-like amidotransferase/phosphosugar isomerase protein
MIKKHNYRCYESCGCCWHLNNVEIDKKKRRVILVHQESEVDDIHISVKVLAILPRIYRP